MNYAILLAGGIGIRISDNVNSPPKQFIEIKAKPIIIYTIEAFVNNKNINHIIVVCHKQWISLLETYLIKFNLREFVSIISGGNHRNASIYEGFKYLKNHYQVQDDDLVLTHDGVRMFVSQDIIDRNIEAGSIYDGVNTVVDVIDTIIEIEDGFIQNIPNRNSLKACQTPQTFKFKILDDIFRNFELIDTSDLCKLVLTYNPSIKIKCVLGSDENTKITNKMDLINAVNRLK